MKQLISCTKLCILLICVQYYEAYEVKYAVNVGGDAFTDSEGIIYEADENKVGTKTVLSTLTLNGAPESDRLLYQTGRYSTTPFGYDIPVPEDGHYVLIIKMGVYTTSVGSYVFNAFLNQNHTILSNFDMVKRAGPYPAHAEYIYFTICHRTLLNGNQMSNVIDNKIRLEFRTVTTYPLISAIVVIKGSIGERKKLTSTNSNATMFFDPKHTPCQDNNNVIINRSQKFINHQFINQQLLPEENQNKFVPYFLFNINISSKKNENMN